MIEPISISEAARKLELSPARVRAMAARGQLPALKIADRWLVERSAVEKRRRLGGLAGRRFTARNAWALLTLASGEEIEGVASSVRSRLKRALALEGLLVLAPRLGRRAEVSLWRAHPGEVVHVLGDQALVPSGISAAATYGAGLVPGREADGYLPASELQRFIKDHALSAAVGPNANVRLRIVPDEVWGSLGNRSTAPPAAVALDLMDCRVSSHRRHLCRDIGDTE